MERKTREKRKREKRVEEISQDVRKKIREEERRKIMKVGVLKGVGPISPMIDRSIL